MCENSTSRNILYIDEGAELHHCLFSNEYYLKENSLILSATIEGVDSTIKCN